MVLRNFTPPVFWKNKEGCREPATSAMKRRDDVEPQLGPGGGEECRAEQEARETYAAGLWSDGEDQRGEEGEGSAHPTPGEDVFFDEAADADFIEIEGVAFGRAFRELGRDAMKRVDEFGKAKCHCTSCDTREGPAGIALCANAAERVECYPGVCALESGCNNRRMQMGQVARTRVSEQPGSSREGVQAAESVEAGGICGEFVGLLTPESELRVAKNSSFAAVCKFANCRTELDGAATVLSVLNARRVGNNMRFLTPVCAPNCELKSGWVQGLPRCLVIACLQTHQGGGVSHDRACWFLQGQKKMRALSAKEGRFSWAACRLHRRQQATG